MELTDSADELTRRSERALGALVARREALESRRREELTRPAQAARGTLAALDADLRRLEAIETSITAADQRLGAYFHIRYVTGHTLSRSAAILRVGRTTVARRRVDILGLLAARPDILSAIEAWAAGEPGPMVGRHRRRA